MTVYYFAGDEDSPRGGVRKMYTHVDILNRNGVPAAILHYEPGFRCTWFEHDTRIAYVGEVLARGRDPSDVLVIPEVFGPASAEVAPGMRKVVFNQNSYYTFQGFSLDVKDRHAPYLHPDVVATLVVSEDNREYLEHAFPGLRVSRIHNGIDLSVFSRDGVKRRQIAFLLTKSPEVALQVVNILKFRGVLDGWSLAPILKKSQAEVAAILKQSAVFLNFGTQEGFGLAPAEAMACGCVVVGYHGMAGREFFLPEFSYPVPIGDVVAFARAAEEVIRGFATRPEEMARKGEAAAEFIRERYSPEVEEQDVLRLWRGLLDGGAP